MAHDTAHPEPICFSFDPIYETDRSYYVNTQLGEDLVTNPDAHSVPEEILLDLSEFIHHPGDLQPGAARTTPHERCSN